MRIAGFAVVALLAACGGKVTEGVPQTGEGTRSTGVDGGSITTADGGAAACGVALPQAAGNCAHCDGDGWQCGGSASYVVPACPPGAAGTEADDACTVQDGSTNECINCGADGAGFLFQCVRCSSNALGGCRMGQPVSCSQ